MTKSNTRYNPQKISQQLCNTGELACGWYHGNWHLLKELGVVSTSAVHEKSIIKLLKIALKDLTNPRILLTGSTDETLVRLINNTCKTLGLKFDLLAIDICATPLAFMQNYATENHIKLTTCCTNVLDFEPDQKFDIILTHAFMGYFDKTQRPLLINKWQHLLKDRGRIITIQRVRPSSSPQRVTFTKQQSTQFINGAIDAAKKTEHLNNDNHLETIKLAASEFTKNFVSHAITSRNELESLFTQAGLSFDFLEYHHLQKKAELSGPSVPSNAEFAHIIAKKSEVSHDT